LKNLPDEQFYIFLKHEKIEKYGFLGIYLGGFLGEKLGYL